MVLGVEGDAMLVYLVAENARLEGTKKKKRKQIEERFKNRPKYAIGLILRYKGRIPRYLEV
jgi:hypothetical protein